MSSTDSASEQYANYLLDNGSLLGIILQSKRWRW